MKRPKLLTLLAVALLTGTFLILSIRRLDADRLRKYLVRFGLSWDQLN